MPSTAEIARQIAGKHSTLESSKRQARQTTNNPSVRPRREEQTARPPAQVLSIRAPTSTLPRRIPASALPARAQEGEIVNKKGSPTKNEESSWYKKYTKIQLQIIRELETKTGKNYDDLKKKLERGTAQDIMETQVAIQQEIRPMRRKMS